MTEIQLQIGGMSCNNCVRHVRRALEAVPGVEIKEVQIGSASVLIDPARVSVDTIQAALTEAGYQPGQSS